jgi:hypothetical protein
MMHLRIVGEAAEIRKWETGKEKGGMEEKNQDLNK